LRSRTQKSAYTIEYPHPRPLFPSCRFLERKGSVGHWSTGPLNNHPASRWIMDIKSFGLEWKSCG
jgi:hypothetical protein